MIRAVTRVSRLLCLLGVVVPPEVALSQGRLHGTIRDSTQGTPLPLVEVLVEGMNLSTRTDAQGRYSLSIPLGFHTLHFRRVGYHPLTRQLRLTNLDPQQYDLTMLSAAQRLDSIRVEAEAPPRSWPPGIESRMKDGFGQFVTDSMLRRFEHSTVSNVLQGRVRGVRFKRILGRNVAFSSRGGRASMARRGIPDCYYAIWLNGVLLWEPDELRVDPDGRLAQSELPPDLDRYSVAGLEAIEVYAAAQVPAQYGGGSAGCGVILLWARNQRR